MLPRGQGIALLLWAAWSASPKEPELSCWPAGTYPFLTTPFSASAMHWCSNIMQEKTRKIIFTRNSLYWIQISKYGSYIDAAESQICWVCTCLLKYAVKSPSRSIALKMQKIHNWIEKLVLIPATISRKNTFKSHEKFALPISISFININAFVLGQALWSRTNYCLSCSYSCTINAEKYETL